MPTIYAHVHASGRWSLVADHLGGDVADWRKRGASVITHTEVGGLSRAEVEAIMGGDTWDWWRGPNVAGQDECAVQWDTRVWSLASGRVVRLTDTQYWRDVDKGEKPSKYPKFHAAVVVLRHVTTGQQVTVIAVHMPTRSTSLRRQVWSECAIALRDFVKATEGLVVVAADWNAGWRKLVDQLLLKAAVAGTDLEFAWDGRVPANADDSMIDGLAVAGLDVVSCVLLPNPKSAEKFHQPVMAVLALPDPTPTPTPEAPVATSQNGYTANDRSRVVSMTIPGTTRKVALRKGAPGELLCEFAAWFDKNIESVDGGILDDWGYAERPIRGSSTTLSNHASGTAMDINAPRHPLGKRGTFTDAQEAKIRAELKRYGGTIRWGGDYKNRADEMHFEIMASPERCAEVLAQVRAGAPTKEAPVGNNVEQGRALVAEALKKFDAARLNGKTRLGVQLMARAIRVALASGPKS